MPIAWNHGMVMAPGISPAPAGLPQIEVTFDVDSNGILSVCAMDKATRQEKQVTISGSSTLAPEDVQEKVKEARRKAAEEAVFEAVPCQTKRHFSYLFISFHGFLKLRSAMPRWLC